MFSHFKRQQLKADAAQSIVQDRVIRANRAQIDAIQQLVQERLQERISNMDTAELADPFKGLDDKFRALPTQTETPDSKIKVTYDGRPREAADYMGVGRTSFSDYTVFQNPVIITIPENLGREAAVALRGINYRYCEPGRSEHFYAAECNSLLEGLGITQQEVEERTAFNLKASRIHLHDRGNSGPSR
jgi:hypothetical protein